MIARTELAWVLAVGLASRIVVFALAALFNAEFGLGRGADALLCSWDCGWYSGLVDDGYDRAPHSEPTGDGANWAFFPLFPLLAHGVAWATGIGTLLAMTVVANACFLAALVVLHGYVRTWADNETARLAVVMLALSPYGLYFSAPYTESLYLLLMIATLHLARQERWIGAGLAAAALSATRNLGVFMVVPLLALGVARFGWRELLRLAPGTERVWLALLLAPLGLALFMLFLHHWTGDALAFKNVQIAWGGDIGNPLVTISKALRQGSAYAQYCALSACSGLAAAVYLWRLGWRAEAWVLGIGILVPAAVRITSAPRYAFTLFPVYLALALALRGSPRAQWLAVSLLVPPGAFLIAAWVAQRPFTT